MTLEEARAARASRLQPAAVRPAEPAVSAEPEMSVATAPILAPPAAPADSSLYPTELREKVRTALAPNPELDARLAQNSEDMAAFRELQASPMYARRLANAQTRWEAAKQADALDTATTLDPGGWPTELGVRLGDEWSSAGKNLAMLQSPSEYREYRRSFARPEMERRGGRAFPESSAPAVVAAVPAQKAALANQLKAARPDVPDETIRDFVNGLPPDRIQQMLEPARPGAATWPEITEPPPVRVMPGAEPWHALSSGERIFPANRIR